MLGHRPMPWLAGWLAGLLACLLARLRACAPAGAPFPSHPMCRRGPDAPLPACSLAPAMETVAREGQPEMLLPLLYGCCFVVMTALSEAPPSCAGHLKDIFQKPFGYSRQAMAVFTQYWWVLLGRVHA